MKNKKKIFVRDVHSILHVPWYLKYESTLRHIKNTWKYFQTLKNGLFPTLHSYILLLFNNLYMYYVYVYCSYIILN